MENEARTQGVEVMRRDMSQCRVVPLPASSIRREPRRPEESPKDDRLTFPGFLNRQGCFGRTAMARRGGSSDSPQLDHPLDPVAHGDLGADGIWPGTDRGHEGAEFLSVRGHVVDHDAPAART